MSSLFFRQSGEISQPDQFGLLRVFRLKLDQSVVKGQKFLIGLVRAGDDVDVGDCNFMPIAAVFQSSFASSLFHQDPLHRQRRRTKKVPTILPCRVFIADQPKKGLMNQGRGLERESAAFMTHLPGSELSQFIIDQGEQIFGSRLTGFDGVENDCDARHSDFSALPDSSQIHGRSAWNAVKCDRIFELDRLPEFA